eukprot:scaffold135428_cov26-Tisochrysis_lutea.AAC.1
MHQARKGVAGGAKRADASERVARIGRRGRPGMCESRSRPTFREPRWTPQRAAWAEQFLRLSSAY